MITAFYTAATGTVQLQKAIDVIANNTANVTTVGFKSTKSSFSDLLYTNIRLNQGEGKLKVGHGAKLNKTDVLHTQGSFQATGRELDFALTDRGFFAIETANGIKYTRNGNFSLSQKDGQFYLASSQGGFVLDKTGNRIVVNNLEDEFNIGVFNFENEDGLQIEGGLFFNQTQASGAPTLANNTQIKRQYLENSNVDLAANMASIIEAQRAFQFNTRIVQVSDEVMQTVNALR